MSSLVGRTLRGKWRIERELGVGGMATVYAATHRNGGHAALKVLHPELAAMREVRARFVREGYLANRVGHPAVVRAIDDDVDEDGTAFLVMELIEGETLEDRAAETRFGTAELLALAEQVLEALESGHENGVIHQDLKPANLLVEHNGRVRLLDFGIARTIDDGECLRPRATGTPTFMSPEQVRGSVDLGPGTDLYSLGATLFAVATGRPPHVGATSAHVLVRIATERAPRVRELAPELPPVVGAFIDRALLDVGERWPSARAMLGEIARMRALLEMPFCAEVLARRPRSERTLATAMPRVDTLAGPRLEAWMRLAATL